MSGRQDPDEVGILNKLQDHSLSASQRWKDRGPRSVRLDSGVPRSVDDVEEFREALVQSIVGLRSSQRPIGAIRAGRAVMGRRITGPRRGT